MITKYLHHHFHTDAANAQIIVTNVQIAQVVMNASIVICITECVTYSVLRELICSTMIFALIAAPLVYNVLANFLVLLALQDISITKIIV